MLASLQAIDMTSDILSSNAFKVLALAVFAILVLCLCAFLLTMNKTDDGRPTKGGRKIKDVDPPKADDEN